MLSQMMFELCEETALLLFPWVFVDEEGNPRDKKNAPPYVELVTDLFEQCFDVVEEVQIQLTEDIIKDMFTESNFEITEDIIFGLTEGKCMIMRLKGRPPHPDWPVKYPVECPDESTDCPVRVINDVEKYLSKIIYDEPPPLIHGAGALLPPTRTSYEIKDFASRHVHVHEPDPEVEDDVKRTYPAVWVPPQVNFPVVCPRIDGGGSFNVQFFRPEARSTSSRPYFRSTWRAIIRTKRRHHRYRSASSNTNPRGSRNSRRLFRITLRPSNASVYLKWTIHRWRSGLPRRLKASRKRFTLFRFT
ncbi:uncharacterized protein [Neodiprion pinetum]|uniref:uncharacterized protein n=1 Tax=Neodiprion pinetum TaxID=441929 RepID=UPI00371B8199